MRVDCADEVWTALAQTPEPLPEPCVVELPDCVVVETGSSYYTTLMLHLKSCIYAEICDWSSDVSFGLIRYEPWELNFNLHMIAVKRGARNDRDVFVLASVISH